MRKKMAEAIYFVAAILFLGICIKVNQNERIPEDLPTFGVVSTPDVSPTQLPTEVTLTQLPTVEVSPTPKVTLTPVSTPTLMPTPTPVPTRIPELSLSQKGEISNEAYEQYDNKSYSWWFRRYENHRPSGTDEEFPIADYDAFYLDQNATEEDKVIYLTFDCGYENGFMPTILDTLAEKNVKAIFFVTKSFIVQNADYVKRMKEEGHLVGNHTVQHLSSPDLAPEELAKELNDVRDAMEEYTGYQIDSFFRPPMGRYSERVLKVIQDMGYATIFWSIAYSDYDINNQPGKAYVVDHFERYHHNGAIPLIHSVSESNTQALGDVIDNLRAEGYRFGIVTELLK